MMGARTSASPQRGHRIGSVFTAHHWRPSSHGDKPRLSRCAVSSTSRNFCNTFAAAAASSTEITPSAMPAAMAAKAGAISSVSRSLRNGLTPARQIIFGLLALARSRFLDANCAVIVLDLRFLVPGALPFPPTRVRRQPRRRALRLPYGGAPPQCRLGAPCNETMCAMPREARSRCSLPQLVERPSVASSQVLFFILRNALRSGSSRTKSHKSLAQFSRWA
jgi:hypothetical protein